MTGAKPFERLVEQHDLGIAHERPRDREHLLLAAGKVRPAAVATLLEAREHLVDAVERPTVWRSQSGEHEILLDVEAAEDAALLVNELHAGFRDRVARQPDQLRTVEFDRARARPHDPHQALQRRRLARAIAPDQRHDLVALDVHVDVEEDVRIAVIAVERLDFDEAHAASP